MIIIGVLAVSTVVIMIIANILLPDTNYSEDDLIQGNLQQRIKPIGQLAINGVSSANASEGESTVVASNDAGEAKSAEELYTSCAACHNAGVLNAPILGDKAGWSERIAKGTDVLYVSAINGIGTMPPKGGRADISDDDIKRVVDYMLESVQ